MKSKDIGINIIVVCYFLFIIVSVILPDILGLYETMLGAVGLQNIIISIVIKILGLLVMFSPFLYLLFIMFGNGKQLSIFVVFMAIILIALASSLYKSNFNEHRYVNKYSSDIELFVNCVSDFANDEYEEFTINDCYVDANKHTTAVAKGGRSYHCEYIVKFYYNDKLVTEMQIGESDYNYLKKSLPYGFDTRITVYKKSRFLRSIEPSVNYSHDESYSHFFNIFISDGKIIYKRNISADFEIKNLMLCGFKKNKSEDIHNAVFEIGISSGNDVLSTDLFCTVDEVCIYAVCDGKYRRLSNIINKNS